MEKLLEKLDDAAKLVTPMLEEKISEEIYINALRELILALNETTAEEIEKLEDRFCGKEQSWRGQKPDQKIVSERGGSGFPYFHACHV